ncbi:sugar transferase [Chryseobacterium sp. SNU WT5]|uniref:sugar transferase n=1 Tax=Chryseobacterium sp. SNU WT5 TaxID=2594269 RepID=UPI00117D5206|nr:sugar transferase [Chryseobacterium sp. SNU WT5]QDP85827.1 sugar transferase [Chryseobacterium sp. SNU WT5]
MYRSILKPITGFSIAFLSLVALSPVFLLITFLLSVSNKGNPFFIQKRPGKNGNIFHIIKFKTMNDKKCENGILLSDYERLTFVGKVVRKTSLDEIPQLINVLKGEMSIVGPRPLLPEYLDLYNEEQHRRHHVQPGITGWAQVNGRNALSWDEKFKYDVEYVEKISPILDAKIMMITVQKVIRRHGVNANNLITMEAFKGNAA